MSSAALSSERALSGFHAGRSVLYDVVRRLLTLPMPSIHERQLLRSRIAGALRALDGDSDAWQALRASLGDSWDDLSSTIADLGAVPCSAYWPAEVLGNRPDIAPSELGMLSELARATGRALGRRETAGAANLLDRQHHLIESHSRHCLAALAERLEAAHENRLHILGAALRWLLQHDERMLTL